MRDESKALVELMMGDAEARLKRMKQAAGKVAGALMTLRSAAVEARDAVSEYMEASGISKTQLVADLGLTAPEARLLGLASPSRSSTHSAQPQAIKRTEAGNTRTDTDGSSVSDVNTDTHVEDLGEAVADSADGEVSTAGVWEVSEYGA